MSESKKKWPLVVGILALCAVIAVVPLALNTGSEFGGADGEAEALVTQIDPDYEPWASPVLEPPGGETESLLFCLQAAIGGGILGFGFGYLRGRARGRAEAEANPAEENPAPAHITACDSAAQQ